MPNTLQADKKWLEALAQYLGPGMVPFYRLEDGSVDAAKTIECFCKLRGLKRIGKRGEELE